jgi:hypothetical protein
LIDSINLAHQNLDHTTIFGKQIKVSFSKHQFVQMPKDGASVLNKKLNHFSIYIFVFLGYGFNKRFYEFTITSI